MPMGMLDRYANAIQMNAIVYIAVVLICITFAWWAIQPIRWEVFLKNAKSPQAKGLQIILALILGYELARFIMEYLSWSMSLQMLF